MLAAASVNLNYLLILLVPSLVVLLMMALTWRSRVKRRRGSQARPSRPSSAKRRRK